MRVIARPARCRRQGLWHTSVWSRPNWLGSFAGVCLLAFLVPTVHHLSARTIATASTGVPQSWLGSGTLLSVYGRGFGTAPYLGRLGMFRNPDDMATQVAGTAASISSQTQGRPVWLAIHLIYGLATPCSAAPRCLLYLDNEGVDIVHRYIEPAAQRGWLVILDDQLGRSSPQAEIERLISRGYLAHDNVEVAFDPEFHTAAGQATPGVPTGQVGAPALNSAMHLMSAYSAHQKLRHQKLLLVHEWIPDMVQHPDHLAQHLPYAQPVLVMDGIGTPNEKVQRYRSFMGNASTDNVLPGIKLFLKSPYSVAAAEDTPTLSWEQLFGAAPIQDAHGTPTFITPLPRVIILS